MTNSTAITLFAWKTLLPVDIASLMSLVVLLCGILSNAFLGLYVGEKFSSPCGIRTLICNQIFANLIALFSYTFVPLYVLDKKPPLNLDRVCKVMPSLGFLGVTVALVNITAICVSYYLGKKTGKFAITSNGASLLIVVGSWLFAVALTIPMTMSLTILEVKVNLTSASMCGAVWSNECSRDIYMNCVLLFKFAVPLLVICSVCFKTELVHLKSKKFQQCREISSVLIDVLAVTCFLLLMYFFPLSSVDRGRFLSRNTGANHAFDIVRILELVALANCAVVPMLLTAFVDEYHHTERKHDSPRMTKHTRKLFKIVEEKTSALDAPPSNGSYITYDVLTADMPEKWRPIPSDVLIV